jgi:hypothetical protein
MKALMLLPLMLVLPALAQAQAQAQAQATVWRCGSDSSSYSAVPCSEGRPLTLDDTARPAADVTAAREMAQRERRLADTLRQERLQREGSHPGLGPAAIKEARPGAAPHSPMEPQATRSKRRQKAHPPADPGTWRAIAPATRHKQG